MTDVDVLVGAADFERAAEKLASEGFRRREDPGRPATLASADSWILISPRGTFLDLHRAVARRRVFPVDHDALLARCIPGRLPGEHWLDAADELQLSCLHHQKHSLRVKLVQIVDAAILAGDGRPDWDRLVSDARAWRTAHATWIGLGWVRAIDRTRVPDAVFESLRPGPVRSRAIRAAMPRLGPRPGDDVWPSRAQQAVVYGLTTRWTDLAMDAAGWVGRRARDVVQSRRG